MLWGSKALALLLGLGVLFLGACGRSPAPQQAPKKEDYPALAEPLFELATAKDPQEAARRFGLERHYKDGQILVVIELEGLEVLASIEWGVEALGGRIEQRAGERLQARVPAGALLKLSRHPGVSFIRPPLEPWPP